MAFLTQSIRIMKKCVLSVLEKCGYHGNGVKHMFTKIKPKDSPTILGKVMKFQPLT